MRDKGFYVTTPIYYVNDVPHIGHAYSTVAADAAARFNRLAGRKTLFLTGTDEHGQKVERAAGQRNLTPQEHCDRMVVPFRNLWERLNISNDDFIRTTEKRHIDVVQSIFQKLYDRGDIYKGYYEGMYCVYEETFWPESQLVDGCCPECGREVEWVKEESYYFKVSKYAPALLDHIAKNPGFVQPDFRRNEVVSFLESGVTDVSVSRTTFKWGIPVPFDEKHVVYVWFDALINYITGAGYLNDPDKFAAFWPADFHIIGKDILRFHAVIWPSMLLAAGIELPKCVFAHGFWTIGGAKMSKSKGVVVDPNLLVDEFGADALRYFLLREVTFGLDGEFTHEALVRRINDDLANDLGNLVHRTIPMMKKYVGGKIPPPGELTPLEEELVELATGCADAIEPLFARLGFREALIEIWKVIRRANKYIDEAAPWALYKSGNEKRLATVMNSLAEAIRIVAILISPAMPQTAARIWEQLGLSNFEAQRLDDARTWGKITPGAEVKKAEPLFPRIELEEEA